MINESHLEPVAPSAEDELVLVDQANTMREAVDSLPYDCRDIYELWHTGDWSEQELADEFAVSRGTIRARIARIRAHLIERVDSDTAFAVGLFARERHDS